MTRIAILGSCITRDLWPFRGQPIDDLLYISRTSLPSLFSPPIAGFRPASGPPSGLGRYQHNALVADLTKTAVARLVAFQPTHLIFDFIDERYDLLAVDGALATYSWELEASGYLRQKAFRKRRDIPRLSDACDRLWREAAGEFAAIVRATPLKHAQLILHGARWAREQRTPQGGRAPLEGVEVLAGRPTDVVQHNDLLEAYEARFAEVMPPMARVDAGDLRLADPDHWWGLSPYHYVPEYYDEVRRQLAGLGVRPADARPAAPSARAA